MGSELCVLAVTPGIFTPSPQVRPQNPGITAAKHSQLKREWCSVTHRQTLVAALKESLSQKPLYLTRWGRRLLLAFLFAQSFCGRRGRPHPVFKRAGQGAFLPAASTFSGPELSDLDTPFIFLVLVVHLPTSQNLHHIPCRHL